MAVDDSYTKALLHMDGADASTTFTDESGKTWTAAGNAQIDTAQSKFGGAAGLFDGTGDYVYSVDHADWYFGTGDFTIDCWIRLNGLPSSGQQRAICGNATDSNNGYYIFIYNDVGTYSIRFYLFSGGSVIFSFNPTISVSSATWFHYALARNGNTWRHFIDGTQVGSTTNSSSIGDYTGQYQIGANVSLGGSYNYMNGWIDEFRLSKGIARWTANFTPPANPYGITAGFSAFF